MKNIPAAGNKHPAQMRQTQATKTDPPAVAGKPGEFVGQSTGITAAFYRFKTPDLKDNSMWIGKCMPMRSLHRNTVNRPGYRLLALATKNIVFFLRLFFLNLFLHNLGCVVISFFFRRLSQKMKAFGISE
jgi:hypothetical protein